ncbi:MAG: transglutaminase family protein [Pirellulales bacterium]
MKYKITHVTTYAYETPVRVCHNLVMLTPREDARVRIRSHNLKISPNPHLFHARRDFFGNFLHAFSIEESHRQLKVISTSRVKVLPRKVQEAKQSVPWESVVRTVADGSDPNWLSTGAYLFDSRRILRSNEFEEYALQSFTPGRPILLCAQELIERIHREFVYDPNATFVNTMPDEAFKLKRGVCQDFAQIAISCLRSLSIPARYVSGYLRTIPPEGKPRLVGADQSHAWLSVYCGPAEGWVDLDPTNNCICGTDHVPIAWGRDYQDVVPLRGVFLGGGQHTLRVSVDVMPL